VRDPAWSGTCPVRPFAAYWGGRPRLAPGMIVGMVSQIGGREALEDLAVELVAELVEQSRPISGCPPPMSLKSCSSTDASARSRAASSRCTFMEAALALFGVLNPGLLEDQNPFLQTPERREAELIAWCTSRTARSRFRHFRWGSCRGRNCGRISTRARLLPTWR
jgi:hypothetical protein